MIATLTGTVAEKLGEVIVLDVKGVGYGVLVPLEDYAKLSTGDSTKIYIHEYIRENAHELFGFTHLDTKRLFEQLLDVNGVGPKMALSILAVGSVEDVRQAIAGGDTRLIQAAPGVGKRLAERVVVELKDKVGLVPGEQTARIFTGEATAQKDEAVQALMSLGFSVQDAVSALSGIDKALSIEERVKQALRSSAL